MSLLSREFKNFVGGQPPSDTVGRLLNAMRKDVHPVDGILWRGDAATLMLQREIVLAATRGLGSVYSNPSDDAVAAALGWLARHVDPKIAAEWKKAGLKLR